MKGLANRKDIERIIDMIRDYKIEIVDLKFVDVPGLWQHFSIPATELLNAEDSIWVEGIGFDGSSIRGFQEIQESDMALMLDPQTAFVDPVLGVPTLSIICDVYDPVKKMAYSKDPRFIARKAEEYLRRTGVADLSYWGPEMEFFVFGSIRFDQTVNAGYYFIDSGEGAWNSGTEENPNLGYKPRYKEGYFPVPPHDTLQDLRSEMILKMIKTGMNIEVHHHEVATAGQCEIDMHYTTLVNMADQCLKYKYVVKNVARQHNLVATFMPKPLFGDNGSGMHTHQSLWKNGQNLFYDPAGYALLSQMGKYYMGGLLKHAHALMAICAPTTNSYKRLVPGYEAPVNLVYSARNRSAAVRIPVYNDAPSAKRVEFRSPDNTCNPYLAFSAMLMAGLDGIESQLDPGEPLEKNTYDLSAEEKAHIKSVPGSLDESLAALEKDHEFLLKGGVFTQDVLETWLNYKRNREIDPVRLRPHPYEFNLYFDA